MNVSRPISCPKRPRPTPDPTWSTSNLSRRLRTPCLNKIVHTYLSRPLRIGFLVYLLELREYPGFGGGSNETVFFDLVPILLPCLDADRARGMAASPSSTRLTTFLPSFSRTQRSSVFTRRRLLVEPEPVSLGLPSMVRSSRQVPGRPFDATLASVDGMCVRPRPAQSPSSLCCGSASAWLCPLWRRLWPDVITSRLVVLTMGQFVGEANLRSLVPSWFDILRKSSSREPMRVSSLVMRKWKSSRHNAWRDAVVAWSDECSLSDVQV